MLALGASLRETAKEAEQGALARVADERRRSLGVADPEKLEDDRQNFTEQHTFDSVKVSLRVGDVFILSQRGAGPWAREWCRRGESVAPHADVQHLDPLEHRGYYPIAA
jgi:hypothetical protein